MERGKLLKEVRLLISEEVAFQHRDMVDLGQVVGESDGVEYSAVGVDTDGTVYVSDENGDFRTGLDGMTDGFLAAIMEILG